ncbi:MAG: hypothetical protein GXX96_29185 [Planctomycetaceae bacterium]|nr:hypothetical protein [Planctomycetaceae bacterium]
MRLAERILIVVVVATSNAVSVASDDPRDMVSEESLPEGVVARLGATRFADHDLVDNLEFTPDGSRVFAVAAGACFWDVATGRRFPVSPGHAVNHGVLSRDGQTVVLVEGRAARVFNSTGELLQYYGGTTKHAVAVTGDGLLAASGAGSDAVLWSTADGRQIRRWERNGEFVNALAFSPDGQWLAIGVSDGEFSIESVDGTMPELRLDGGRRSNGWLVFSSDGETLAGGLDTCCRLWDMTTVRRKLDIPGTFNAGAFSPDGKEIALGGLRRVTRFDAANGQHLWELPGLDEHVWAVAYSRDGKMLAAGQGNRIRLWSTESWQEVRPATGHSAPVQTVAFSPDGEMIATGGLDGRIILWSWPEGREARRIEGVGTFWGVQHLAFGPDSRILGATAPANWDDMFHVFDAATGTKVARFGRNCGGRGPLVFLPNGTQALATWGKGSVGLWDVSTGNRVPSAAIRKFTANAVALTPGKETAWCLEEDGRLILRSLTSGESLRVMDADTPSPGWQLSIPADDWLALGDHVWNAGTGERVPQSSQLPGSSRGITATSPNGRLLASGKDRKIVLWEILTREEVHVLSGAVGNVNALAFSPDGTVLAVAGDVDTLVWDMTGRFQEGRLAPAVLNSTEMEALWQKLGGEDGWQAHLAAWTLAAAENEAVAFLRTRLRRAASPNETELAALRARFHDPDYDDREQAARTLLDLGVELRPEDWNALRRPEIPTFGGFGRQPTRFQPPPVLLPLPDRVRSSRAVMALEYAKTGAAMQFLEELAKGHAPAPLTKEARAALCRMQRHP